MAIVRRSGTARIERTVHREVSTLLRKEMAVDQDKEPPSNVIPLRATPHSSPMIRVVETLPATLMACKAKRENPL